MNDDVTTQPANVRVDGSLDEADRAVLEVAVAGRVEATIQQLRQQPTPWQRAALQSGVSRRPG